VHARRPEDRRRMMEGGDDEEERGAMHARVLPRSAPT
jgi:hypothetical protein